MITALTATVNKRHEKTGEYTDPVCGMTTEDEGEFLRYNHNGEPYYFCSEHCLKKFKEDPESYSSQDAATPDDQDS